MGKYRILKPVTFLKGNKVVRYRKPSTDAVNLDDAVAKKLGDKVRAVGEAGPVVEEEKPDTKGSADATPSQQASAAASATQRGARK